MKQKLLKMSLVVILLIGAAFYLLKKPESYPIPAPYDTANLEVVTVREGVNSVLYSAPSSAIIIKQDGTTYYALTALHVVSDDTNTYKIKLHEKTSNESLTTYYDSLPVLVVEQIDFEHDVALVSFESERDLTVITLSQFEPQKNDRVYALGNPQGTSGVMSEGRISSQSLESITYSDGSSHDGILKHSASTRSGNSGGAVLNENFELIGVSVGGREVSLLGLEIPRFNESYMVPLYVIKHLIPSN